MRIAVSAGLVLGGGSVCCGCSGLKRDDLPQFQKEDSQIPNLDGTAKAILYHASLAPSGHNSQPWRIRIQRPEVWVVEADADRRLPAVDPENRELLLSLGAFAENLSLAAGAMGWAADIEVIGRARHDRDVMRVSLRKDRPTNYPLRRLKARRTVKNGFLPTEIAAGDVEALSKPLEGRLSYFPRGSTHAACIQESAVENYRIQTLRDDAQRELVQWLRLSDRDARRYRDGLTTEGMEIQGIKGWFVRHFVEPADFLKDSYRRQGVDLAREWAQQGAGWLVVTSPGQAVSDLIETGRRFERMALLARERGIAIQPMTQILEEENGLSLIAEHHGHALFPQFVLRVGYLKAYPDPVSLRRPVEWFLHA